MRVVALVVAFLLPAACVHIKTRSCPASSSRAALERTRRAPRAAVVLRGESFREGPQYSREISQSSDLQLQATQSQIRFLVEPLERHGLQTDVFMATYKTPFFPMLRSAWGGRVKAYNFSKRPGSQEQSVWDAVSLAWSQIKRKPATYRLVVVLRHDMVLKQDLAALFLQNPSMDSKFLVPFKISNELLFGMPDRVPDTLQVIPGHLFECFMAMLDNGNFWPGEGIQRAMLQQFDGAQGKIGLIADWYGDSDPAKFQNPLYGFIQRKDGPVAPEMASARLSPQLPAALMKFWLMSSLLWVLLFSILGGALLSGLRPSQLK